jgi:hypothetical protein
MKSITIRGVDDIIAKKLKEAAAESQKSINQTIISLIKKGLGMEENPPFAEYHDLDDLAGTWTKKELEEFNTATEEFSKIDEDLWK